MTHKLIKTDNYLLVVSDEDINTGDYYYSSTELDININYGTALDLIPVIEEYGLKKVTAHLPLNGSPILEGVDLLPPLEDDVEEAEKAFTEVLDSETKQVYNKIILDATEHGFIIGYNKAREKFLSELHNQILDFTYDLKRDPSQHRHFEGALFGLNRLKYYLSQYPTEFECEMETIWVRNMDRDVPTKDDFDSRPKTITTAQGVQWVGKYI